MASVEDVLELLRDERRRYALYYLRDAGGSEPVPIDELAGAVAEMRAAEDEGSVPEERIADLKVNLRHVQLPKVNEAEFAEYDPEEGVVRLVREPSAFEALAAVAEVMERSEA